MSNIISSDNAEEIENIDFQGKSTRQIKISLEIRNIAQKFFQKESSGVSLITVTKATISKDLKNTDIYITIFPEIKESNALNFAKRMRNNLRTEIKNNMSMRTIPRVDIKIDEGEKIRQKIDQIFKK